MKKENELYEDSLLEEIIGMILINLKIIYRNSNEYLINLRRHCKDNYDEIYKSLPYSELVFYVEEVLTDLIKYPYLYDFRPLE